MNSKAASAGLPAGRSRARALLAGLLLAPLPAAAGPARAAGDVGPSPTAPGPETGPARAVGMGRPAARAGLREAAAPGTPAALAASVPSGLAWRSGATTGGFPCLAQMRGRPLDVVTTFVPPGQGFAGMVTFTAGSYWRANARKASLAVVSLPLLTNDTRGQFAQCAAGAFDGYFRQIGANLKAAGAQGTVVRLGWEANVGSRVHPWGYDRLDQLPAYRGCFRHAALALKAGGPGLEVEWTNAKKGQAPFNVLWAYPGDDVVDLWGVHYYDTGPEKNTQAAWNASWGATWHGGPWGIGTWLRAAASQGKKLGIAEWGVWRQGGQSAAAADDPFYVYAMLWTFYHHASYIAYETYFDAIPGQHMLCPSTAFPNAAVTYKYWWNRGVPAS